MCESIRRESRSACMGEEISVTLKDAIKAGRGDRIRTCDLLVPNQALYQAKLRPEVSARTMAGDRVVTSEEMARRETLSDPEHFASLSCSGLHAT